ncbi:MAG: sugar phosphate isomerase/epimerase [Candidatus Bathyarchaeia archaeon]
MKVALQLYTVRDKMAKDCLSTLQLVAEAGYRAVEFAGHPYGTLRAGELRRVLDGLGLKPLSAHIGFGLLEEKPRETLGYASELGLEYVVSEPDMRRIDSLEKCLEAAEKMDALGEQASMQGMRFGMHNHAIEFEKKFEGKTAYGILVENTDPKLVFFQPDVYWIRYAGYDPCKVIESLKGRCPLVHLKDMKDDVSKEMVELGQGSMDFKAIVRSCEGSGTNWYIFENDRPSVDSIESIKIALMYLKNNFPVE